MRAEPNLISLKPFKLPLLTGIYIYALSSLSLSSFSCLSLDNFVGALNNCSMVLGSYAHFLWEAEEEECEDDAEMETHVPVPATVEAF